MQGGRDFFNTAHARGNHINKTNFELIQTDTAGQLKGGQDTGSVSFGLESNSDEEKTH